MSTLESLLARVEQLDPDTADGLRDHMAEMSKRRAFGLNFRRGLPERITLPTRDISVGDKVTHLPKRGSNEHPNDDTFIVEDILGDVAILTNTLTGERTERALADVAFVADFRDPIHPGLRPVAAVHNGPKDAPVHTVINGENYHALEALRYTHTGKVDLIYIDPPYNTGNQGWIYNDKYVGAEDGDKHSKWLAFMERRLLISRELLKDTGVIFVAIGDDEHHRLRMLMDQVFGAGNFLNNIVWDGGFDSRSRFASRGHDYMIAYAKNSSRLGEVARWVENKSGLPDLEAIAAKAWSESNDPRIASAQVAKWLRKEGAHLAPGLKMYSKVDQDGRLYTSGDLSCPAAGTPYWYDVIHPASGKSCVKPPQGWRHSPARFAQNLEEGRILFGDDHTTVPRFKRYITDSPAQVPRTVFAAERSAASKHLDTIFGDKRFPYPKDHAVLMRWFRMAAPKDAVILDFFGGSGTTTEAVLRLNAEDGGTRQSILVTNNELAAVDAKKLTKAGHRPGDPEWDARGVFEYVTRPRIETVVTGVRPDGSTYSDGLKANVEFFELTYENPEVVEMDFAFKRIAPLLWLQTGATGTRVDTETRPGYGIGDRYAVLFDPDAAARLVRDLRDQPSVATVFVVTDDEPQFQAVNRQLPAGVAPIRLYSSYLHMFSINTGTPAAPLTAATPAVEPGRRHNVHPAPARGAASTTAAATV